MHHSGPLPRTFEGPEQGFGDKNCQNASPGKPWLLEERTGISSLNFIQAVFARVVV